VGGAPRNRLAALDATVAINDATSWDPNLSGGNVNALALSGTTVYAGGSFNAVNAGTPRNRIAAFDATVAINNATAWNPNALGGSVSALAVSGSTVYAGGLFANIGGGARNRVACLDAATGVAPAVKPDHSRAQTAPAR